MKIKREEGVTLGGHETLPNAMARGVSKDLVRFWTSGGVGGTLL